MMRTNDPPSVNPTSRAICLSDARASTFVTPVESLRENASVDHLLRDILSCVVHLTYEAWECSGHRRRLTHTPSAAPFEQARRAVACRCATGFTARAKGYAPEDVNGLFGTRASAAPWRPQLSRN